MVRVTYRFEEVHRQPISDGGGTTVILKRLADAISPDANAPDTITADLTNSTGVNVNAFREMVLNGAIIKLWVDEN